MDYTSVDFNVAKISEYTLFITPDITKHTLAVVDKNQVCQLIAEFDPTHPSTQVEQLLGLAFEEVKIAVPQLGFTGIPEELYDPEKHGLYDIYMPNYQLSNLETSAVTISGMVYLVQLDKHLCSHYIHKFPHAKLISHLEVVLRNTISTKDAAVPHTLLAYQRHGRASIVCLKGSSILYYNDFESQNSDDLKYYLSSILKELNLSPSETALHLAGDFAADDRLQNTFSSSFSKISLLGLQDIFSKQLPDAFKQSQYKYFVLFGLGTCG